MTSQADDLMTLDPPGRIAVIGAGPLGLEAALYGRFLGYDVTVFERGLVAQSLLGRESDPLPMLPSTCLSPLARAALKSQFGTDSLGDQHPFPVTIGQWVRDGLEKLAATDLLRGRVLLAHEVVRIGLSDSAPGDQLGGEGLPPVDDGDDEFEIVGEVPPDFKLSFVRLPSNDSGRGAVIDSLDFEAVIWTSERAANDRIAGFSELRNAPYFFCIGGLIPAEKTNLENRLRTGLQEIVRVYAELGGRAELDLYRPKRI